MKLVSLMQLWSRDNGQLETCSLLVWVHPVVIICSMVIKHYFITLLKRFEALQMLFTSVRETIEYITAV